MSFNVTQLNSLFFEWLKSVLLPIKQLSAVQTLDKSGIWIPIVCPKFKQWGLKIETCSDFEWSIIYQFWNGLDFEWLAIFDSDFECRFLNWIFKMAVLAWTVLYISKKKLNVWISNGQDYSYIDICGTNHSKSEPFKNRTLNCSVFGWRSVFWYRFRAPTVF